MSRSGATDVCLLTPGQPSNNPRLVKEADALAEAGYTVHVLCVDCGLWPSETDSSVMAARPWACRYVGGMVHSRPLMHRIARLRLALTRRMLRVFPESEILQRAAMVRVGPELEAAALQHPAKLYIAHHAAVLPAAARAAAKFGGKVGYDAEDFYTGLQAPPAIERCAADIERKYLPACDYVTASTREIAAAYVEKYHISPPVTVLNVFPLAQRPTAFRTGITRGPLRLYWFSQCIGAGRGLEDVVRALGLLGDCEIELHLRGNWQAGYRERLLALAGSVGVRGDRIVSHAPAPPDDMVRLAAEYDIGLALEQPVDRNKLVCLSNKLFVYLLAGNAVAATNVGAQQSLIAEVGAAGWCYVPGDISSLAGRLHKWSLDRRSLEAARRRAWEWGEQRYNWDIEQRAFLDAVKGALSGSAAPVFAGVSIA